MGGACRPLFHALAALSAASLLAAALLRAAADPPSASRRAQRAQRYALSGACSTLLTAGRWTAPPERGCNAASGPGDALEAVCAPSTVHWPNMSVGVSRGKAVRWAWEVAPREAGTCGLASARDARGYAARLAGRRLEFVGDSSVRLVAAAALRLAEPSLRQTARFERHAGFSFQAGCPGGRVRWVHALACERTRDQGRSDDV